MPYVVQGAERFFERAEVRQAMVALRGAVKSTPPETPLGDAVVLAAGGGRLAAGRAARRRRGARAVGGAAALVALAEEVPAGSLEEFTAELARRAAVQHAPTVEGVTLASLHSAKGLEWDAVFLVGLAEGTLPTTYAKTPEALEEERRLLYVGHHPRATVAVAVVRVGPGAGWEAAQGKPVPAGANRRAGKTARKSDAARPSPYRPGVLPGLRRGAAVGRGPQARPVRGLPVHLDEELLDRLREWRSRVAVAQKVPAYVVFTDATLTALAERRPERTEQLIEIAGIGPRKLGLYGDAVMALVGGAAVDDLTPEKTSTTES